MGFGESGLNRDYRYFLLTVPFALAPKIGISAVNKAQMNVVASC